MATVDIEWVGDPPLLDDVTKLRIQVGEIPRAAARVLRNTQANLTLAIKGVTKRVVDPEYFGTSRSYVWGPNDFVTAVEREDVDKIMGSSSGHQFRVVGQPGVQIIQPPSNLVLVNEIEGGVYDVFPRR